MNFSVINTIASGFKTYKKHWGLVVLAAALSSSPWLVRPLLDPIKVKIDNKAVKALYESEKDSEKLGKKLGKLVKEANNQAEKKLPWSYVFNLFLYIITLFFSLGFIKICFELVDSDRSSLKTLVSQGHCIVPAIGAGIIVTIVSVSIWMLIIICMKRLAISSFLALCTILLLFTPFMFYLWCIVDKSAGAIESFSCSFNKVKDLYIDCFLFVFAVTLLTSFFYATLKMIFNTVLSFIPLPLSIYEFSLGSFLASVIVMPFIYVVITHAYRNLD